MTQQLAQLKPQVYADPRPQEYFGPYYASARERGPDGIYDLVRLVLMPYCMVAFRTRCIDAPHVRGSGGAILAPSHFSAMGHFFCALYLRSRLQFMTRSHLFRPPLQWILRHGGAFPVRRGRHDEEAVSTARAILWRGGVIVIYPEGGRPRSGRMGEHARPGVGRLALGTGAPVVPVAIHGSPRARNWKRLDFPEVTMQHGAPLCCARIPRSTREAQLRVADEVLGAVRGLYAGLECDERRSAVRRARGDITASAVPQPKKTSAVS
jgi:1-acyl-sn-glycerol-3-phosphate acyltransferase